LHRERLLESSIKNLIAGPVVEVSEQDGIYAIRLRGFGLPGWAGWALLFDDGCVVSGEAGCDFGWPIFGNLIFGNCAEAI